MTGNSIRSQSSDDDVNKLRKVVRERAARIAAAALAQGGLVEPGDVESLRALQDLCATLESLQPKPQSNRWLSAGLFIFALACASVLLLRMSTTAVEINVTAGSGEFRLAEDRLLTEPAVVTSVRLVGVQRLSGELCPGWVASSPPDLMIAADVGQNPITVQPIQAKSGLTVAVRATSSPNQWEFAFSGAPLRVTWTVEGAVTINDKPCPATGFPRAVTASFDERASRLMLEFGDPHRTVLPALLPVESLSFVRTDFVEAQGLQQTSSLLGGTIFLEDLNGKEIKLRDGEWLDVTIRHNGWLHPPQASGPSLAWRYRGSVDALSAGPIDGQRNLKPSWLEYARTQHALELLWGTALSLFGMGGALFRWWTPRT